MVAPTPAMFCWNRWYQVVLAVCILLIGSSAMLNAQPHMLFAKQAYGIHEDLGYSVAADSSGNTYVTGRFNGTTDFDPGPGVFNMTSSGGPFSDDVFLLKLDPNQNLLWAKQWGGIDEEFAYSIQIDKAGYFYVYGYFEGNVDFDPGVGVFNLNAQGASYDAYLSKFDFAGNFIWAKRIMSGTGDAYAKSMTIDDQGNIYTAGYILGTADADPGTGVLLIGTPGMNSIFVAKYDSAGAVQWAKAMIGNDIVHCFSVAVDAHGNVFTTGGFLGSVDFDPGPGTYNLTNTSIVHMEIYVNKLDSSGNFVWADLMAGGISMIFTDMWGTCVMADDSGNVYYTGYFHGTVDFDPGPGVYNLTSAGSLDMFLGKLDSLGHLIWTFSLGNYGNELGYSLGMDSTNHILLSGLQNSDSLDYDPSPGVHMEYSSNNVDNAFVAKYTTSGDLKCVFLIKHAFLMPIAESHHMAVYGDKVYLTGGFVSTTDFDPCPAVYNQTHVGSHDLFYAAYDFSTCDCALQLASAQTDVSCHGSCSGSASVTPLGGTPPYVYNWLPSGGSNSTASNLCAGTYTCTVIDVLGDSVAITVTITEPSLLTSVITSVDLQCNSICTGSAQVTASGGSPGYTYNWSNNQNTSAINSLCAGTYSVLITDNNGCTAAQAIAIAQPSALSGVVTTTGTPCNSSFGAIDVIASGGSGTLIYMWQPTGDTTSTINNLPAGTYSVTITDQNGCTITLCDTVVAIGAPIASAGNVSSVLCYGDSTGSASVNASGNGPFTYQWFPSGGSAATATGLSAGSFTVLVTDNVGCTASQIIGITQPAPIAVTASSSGDLCSTYSGSISVTPSGGVSPYAYLWSNSQTTSSLSGLTGGTYSVTLTDNNGCLFDTTFVISSTVAPSLTVSSLNNVLCYGDSTGSSTVATSGGATPYAYSWLPFGGSSANATGLSTGTYTIIVTGSDGCADTITTVITEPLPISAACFSSAENCNYHDGSAFVLATGGAGNYTYLWSNNSVADTITQLGAGAYSVMITDQNGCVEMCSVVVNTTATVNADAGADVTIESGQSTLLNGSGGMTCNWQPADLVDCYTCFSTSAAPTQTTTFILTVTDSAGCFDTDTIVVHVEIPCDDIFVPNAFSPNNDGQNDVLFVRGTCIATFSFRVFNRWGELVFETSDQSIGWDGKWRGIECENAVFTYSLRGHLTDATPFEKHGNVSLVR